MPSRTTKTRAGVRWLLPVALTLTPKCILCIAGYAGLGAALSLGGPELCGAPAGSPDWSASSFAQLGLAVALGAAGIWFGQRRAPATLRPICTAE